MGNKLSRYFCKIVFSRTMIIIVMLLIQIGMVLAGFKWLSSYMHFIIGGFSVLGGILIIYIINKEDNPAFKLAWIIPVCLFPVFGALLYLSILLNPGGLGLKSQIRKKAKETEGLRHTDTDTKQAMEREDAAFRCLAGYLENQCGFPAYGNTDVTYFPLGEDKFRDMLEELKRAESFIFLEYFIIERGIMWDAILKILEEKAAQGVEVRVMYDGMCSILMLPYRYPKVLERKGIHARMFAPIKPMLSTHQNNRDHRKILVIDGRVAYTGGVNLADEYINRKAAYGHWKDVAVKLEGPAVKSFTRLFLEMWSLSGEPEDYGKYMDATDLCYSHKDGEEADNAFRGFVIPYGDSPFDGENTAESVYMDILYQAKKYVHIMSPYLIIDHEMLTALQYAAKRGVEVKLMLPHIPDKKAAFDIARTYYPALLKAGVELYEYTPGFVHAKCFVSDDEKAVVGTINLDYRSLYLHFECGAYLYRSPAVAAIEEDYKKTLEVCTPVTMEYYRRISLLSKISGKVLRLIAPML